MSSAQINVFRWVNSGMRIGLGLIGLLACLGGLRGQVESPQVAPGVITDVGQFWNITGPERQMLHHVRFQTAVCYYDPEWKLLWGETDGVVNYFRCGEKRFPIHEGQRILIDGLMAPVDGLNLDRASIKVLASDVPLAAKSWQFGGTAMEASRLPTQRVSLKGFVNRQASIDRYHILLDLTVGKWPVQARILLPEQSVEPQFDGAFIQASGVLVPNTTPAGQLSTLALWIARPTDVTATGWLRTDPQFNRARVAIHDLPGIASTRMVRVVGAVWSQEPGHSITIRDDTGQVTVLTGQLRAVPRGTWIEAIGRPDIAGTNWRLKRGLFRVLPSAQAQGEKPLPVGQPILRLSEQVLALGNEHADRGLPVDLFGVVTWSNPDGKYFYLSDASGGIQVDMTNGRGRIPVPGNAVEVTGTSRAGTFAPEVRADRVTVSGSLSMPEAQDVTLDQALTGVEEARWIGLQGYLRGVSRTGSLANLQLTTTAGGFTALMPYSSQIERLVGSVVRLRGVCQAMTNKRHELTGIRLLVPADLPDYVAVEEPMPQDPFSVPERSIASLRQFNPLQAINQRVRIAGVVLLQDLGRYLFLQEGTDTLLVLSLGTERLAPGDRVQVVGFPGRQGGRLVLREAIYRRQSAGPDPTPFRLDPSKAAQEDLDGHLIRVTGVLLEAIHRNGETRYMLQGDKAVFEAVLDHDDRGERLEELEPGSRLVLTGVYEVQYDEYQKPGAFQVQLRTPQDVRVISRPSWWTARRALAAMGLFALCTALGGGWVFTLRRRVRHQTAQIRAQVEREARLEAELQRSLKLESLGVLAGGIAHDFNNLLTVIMGNLTLAKLDTEGQTTVAGWLREAERGVTRAKDLTLQLLTFAKGGDPVRKAVALPEAVREAAEFALHGSPARCDFVFDADLWPAEVDRGQIGQVVQNIVINAAQAMPGGGVIRIALQNVALAADEVPGLALGRYVKLTIADTGIGIEDTHLARVFDPYFTTKAGGSGLGLATVYSIIKRHQGRIDVQSEVGRGTTFTIWLPAAEATVAGPETSATPSPEGLTGRVLVMDDDEAIRESAVLVLRRLGLDATAVADGQEVLREYAAAQEAGRPYNLVILDLTIPGGMGGKETLQKLLEVDPGVRALVSSGYSSDPVLAHHREHGFVGVVPKPYDFSEIGAAVAAAMQGQKD